MNPSNLDRRFTAKTVLNLGLFHRAPEKTEESYIYIWLLHRDTSDAWTQTAGRRVVVAMSANAREVDRAKAQINVSVWLPFQPVDETDLLVIRARQGGVQPSRRPPDNGPAV